jgi:hypothetical protein
MEKELFEEGVEELMFQEVYVIGGESENQTVYESYEGKPQIIKPKNKPKANNNLLPETEEEYIDYQPAKGKKSLKTEYAIKNDPFKNPIPKANNKAETTMSDVYRAKKVSETYTGYKIKLLVVDEMLSANHSLFREMGGVEMDVTNDEKYAYLIGNFSNEKSAKHFLNTVIKGRFPEAMIQEYEDGQQVVN